MNIRNYLGAEDTRPLFYFINCAVSLDSKLSIRGAQVNISSEEDWKIVHGFRNELVAIVVGATTIKIDNPTLLTNEKYLEGQEVNHPIRVVLDPKNLLEGNENIFNHSNSQIVLIRSKEISTSHRNTETLSIGLDENYKLKSLSVLHDFFSSNELRGDVMIEGGASVITSLIQHPLVNSMRIYRSPIIIGSQGVDLFNTQIERKLHLSFSREMQVGIEEVYILENSSQ